MENNESKFLIYSNPNGEIRVDVFVQDETVWLTQKSLAGLFDTSTQNITTHLKNIYEAAELQEEATCKEFLQVQTEGRREVSRNTKFYNLYAIISVGYVVDSSKATQFGIWATQTLKEYIIKLNGITRRFFDLRFTIYDL